MTAPPLTVLIPCLNEARGIGDVVREYAAAFPQATVLVVDNGSEDETAAAARAAGAQVITERRRGKATAVASALAAIDTELVLMVDGDGSYPADGARLLVEQYLREPVDMITGIRSAQQATQVFRPLHQWGMSIFASVLNSVFRFKPLDLFSGLRLFSRRFYKHVPVLSRGFELEIELTIQAVDKGFAQTEIPGPVPQPGARLGIKTQNRARRPADFSAARRPLSRLSAPNFFRSSGRGRRASRIVGRLHSGRRIFHHRVG